MPKEKGVQKDTEAKKWLEKIDRAKEVKKQWYDGFRIALAYEYLEGRQMPPGWSVEEWITINLYYSNLRAILPTLYRTDPYFYVKLKKSYRPNPLDIALFERMAWTRQAMLNYLKAELDIKPKLRLAIFDSMFQFGVIKVHHEADLIDNPKYGETLKDDDGLTIFDDNDDPIMEPEYLPANEAYRVTRVHPNDIIFDEDAGPLEDEWSWIAQRITCTVEDIKNDKRYDEKVRKTVKPTELKDDIIKDQERRQKGLALSEKGKASPNIVVKYELYNLKAKEWMVLCEGADDFLVKPSPLPEGIEKHPYSFLRFFLRDASPYPIPPCSQWLDPQKEYCQARSKIQTHRKRFNRKYMVWMGGLDSEDEISKLEIGDDGTCIKVSQPSNVVTPIMDASLDQNHWQELAALRKDFDDVAVGPNQRGAGTGVDSATEAGIIEKRVVIQEGDDISQVADFVTKMAEKLDMQVQTHLTEDQAVKVSGPDGVETWEPIRMEHYQDVAAEYQYSVNLSSMQPQLPEIERSQWIAFLTMLMNAPQLMLSRRLVMKSAEMFHIDDETLVDELMKIAQQMMSGMIPMAGQQGSTPGSPPLPGAGMSGAGAGINNIRGGMGGM